MSFRKILLDEVGKAFVFKSIRPNLRSHFFRAGIPEVPYGMFGAIFWVTVFATASVYFTKLYPWLFSLGLNPIEFFFAVFLAWLFVHSIIVGGAIFTLYVYLDFRIHSRAAEMESKLQDYLQFVSENLKGGMSFERALWSAVRPQFGVLADEMRLAAKKVMTGSDVEDALSEFTTKYPSPILQRSFQIIVEGTKGGAEIAEIIDRVVENLEELKELKGEIRATNLTYIIFIGFVVVVVAPLLFALSFQFLLILSSFSSRLDIAQGSGGVGLAPGFGLGKASLDVESFRLFSQAALMVTAIFSGFIISIIEQGNLRGSTRYIPPFVIISQVLYFMFTALGTSLFGGLFS